MATYIDGNKVDVSQLDARKLFEPGLISNGWRTLHYIFNVYCEPREFERNTQTVEDSVWLFFLLIAIPFSLLFYHYWPFKIMGLMMVGGILLGALMSGIAACNKGWHTGTIYTLTGAAAFYFHLDVGLEILGQHFNEYYFMSLMATGLLILLRRAWNGLAWYIQDKAVLRLYIDNKLDLTQVPLPIDDYCRAFTDTRKALIRLIEAMLSVNNKQTPNPDIIREIDILLGNGTQEGLIDALTFIKKEAKRCEKNR